VSALTPSRARLSVSPAGNLPVDRESVTRIAEAHARDGAYHRAAETYMMIRDVPSVVRLAEACLRRNDAGTAADVCALLVSDSVATASLYAPGEAASPAVLRRRVRFLLDSVLRPTTADKK
jgi:hypothetical protein